MLYFKSNEKSFGNPATVERLVRMFENQERIDTVLGKYLDSRRTIPTIDIPTITCSNTAPASDTDAAAKQVSMIGRSAVLGSSTVNIDNLEEIKNLSRWVSGFNTGLHCQWRFDQYNLATHASSNIGDSANGQQNNNLTPQMRLANNGVYTDLTLSGDVLFISVGQSASFAIWVNDRLLTTAINGTTNPVPAIDSGVTVTDNMFFSPAATGRRYLKLKFTSADERNIRIFHAGPGGLGDFYIRAAHTLRPRFSNRLNWLHVGDSHSVNWGNTNKLLTSTMHMASCFGPSVNIVNASVATSGWATASTVDPAPNWLERWDVDLFRNQRMDVVTLFGSFTDGNKVEAIQNIPKLINKIRSFWPEAEIIVSNTVVSNQTSGADIVEEEKRLKAALSANASIVRVQTDPTGRWFTGSGSSVSPNQTGNFDIYGGNGSPITNAGHLYLGNRWGRGIYEAMLKKLGE